MQHEGVVVRGKELFANEQKTMCLKCHSVDGTSSKAGPDLAFIGDKFPRGELIAAVLEPSATIAVGYGATTIVTKSDEEFTGIIKQATGAYMGLMGADGKLVRIPTSEIAAQQGNNLSLMPEGLEAGLSPQEFTDLTEYLVSLKEPHCLPATAACPLTFSRYRTLLPCGRSSAKACVLRIPWWKTEKAFAPG
jgi:putative heme-binding domain-containing protein